jgi:hypothetical protein
VLDECVRKTYPAHQAEVQSLSELLINTMITVYKPMNKPKYLEASC